MIQKIVLPPEAVNYRGELVETNLRKLITKHGENNQVLKAAEEFLELEEALGSGESSHSDIFEEVVDSHIMIAQLCIILHTPIPRYKTRNGVESITLARMCIQHILKPGEVSREDLAEAVRAYGGVFVYPQADSQKFKDLAGVKIRRALDA